MYGSGILIHDFAAADRVFYFTLHPLSQERRVTGFGIKMIGQPFFFRVEDNQIRRPILREITGVETV